MSNTIATGADCEFGELMDFLLSCFLTNDPEHKRFEDLYPDVYRADSPYLGNIMAVRRDGRLASSVGYFPIPLRIHGNRVLIYGVGGVATHPDFRGHSLMRGLMDEAVRRIKAENPPFAWLAGNRIRYGYWGWEKAGCQIHMSLWNRNISKKLRAVGMEISEPTHAELPWLEMDNLRNSQIYGGAAGLEEWKLRLKRAGIRCFAAFEQERLSAYILTDQNAHAIYEWGGSPAGLSDLLIALAEKQDCLDICLPPYRDDFFKLCLSIAEGFELVPCCNFAVVNLGATLDLLKPQFQAEFFVGEPERCANLHLLPGPFGEQTVSLRVGSEGIRVGMPESGVPELALDAMAMAGLIFGPLPASVILDDPRLAWLDSIFPLIIQLPKTYFI